MAESKLRLNEDKISEDAKKDTVSPKDLLLKKKRRTETHNIFLGDEEMEIQLTALAPKDWDKITSSHPVRKGNDRDRNAGWNVDTYPVAALAAVISSPEMSVEDWDEAVWSNPNWSDGERLHLFGLVLDIQGKGLNIPFGSNV